MSKLFLMKKILYAILIFTLSLGLVQANAQRNPRTTAPTATTTSTNTTVTVISNN